MSSFQKSLLSSKLPPKSFFLPKSGSGIKRSSLKGRADYSPITWENFFDAKHDVLVKENKFRVYVKGDAGPALVLLHGGGFSALTWSLLAKTLFEMVECRVVAMDLRGHGDTLTTDDNELSIDNLANDVVEVINTFLPENTPLVLVGHSLGGSIAVHAGHHPNLHSLIGLVIIDVVEGTALGALSSMQNILRGRPQFFNTVDEAIRWSVQSGHLKNLESARVSMPGQIKNTMTNESAIAELETMNRSAKKESEQLESEVSHPQEPTPINLSGVESISEEEEAQFKLPNQVAGKYSWRIDLRATEKHWPGWFKGLSQLFLSCHAQKLLLLASLDRLDTDLTVAQMQGKFEVHAFEQSRGRCGHAVHEDIPEAVAEVLATYLVRNKFATSKTDIPGPMPCC